MDKNSILTTALIIFVRHPELGKVKTRLAKVIGDEKALNIYKQLLNHTHQITSPLNCRKFVYYAEDVIEHDLWSSPGFTKRKQSGNDLGERMATAFKDLFDQGFQKVLIIGSDCYQLKTDILQEAIHFLGIKEAVIGPTFDGGYYLLGTNRFVPKMFADKPWSTDQVTKQTLEDLDRLNLSYHLLKKLHDVDEAADLEVNQIFI
ncbi:MAG: TIGR04282 family arsenosugar biosynthesis glycosyltransferase [Janthinobacterium lividum]